MLLDELQPEYDVAARYEIVVEAPAAQTAAALESADFSRLRIATLLMALRRLGQRRRKSDGRTQIERLGEAGFVKLGSIPTKEVVFGIVGRFWRVDSGIEKGLKPEQVIAFDREGYAKAAWNFAIAAETESTCRLSTETRIQAYGQRARWKFRAYWFLIGFFSGLIRKEMLAMVKRRAEQSLGS